MNLALDASIGRPEATAWSAVERGKLEWSVGRVGRAAASFRFALVVVPGYAPALDALARVEHARGRTDKAIELQRQAIAAIPLPHLVGQLGDLLAAARSARGGARAVRRGRRDRADRGRERRRDGSRDGALPDRPRDPPPRVAPARPRGPCRSALGGGRRRARLGAHAQRPLRRGQARLRSLAAARAARRLLLLPPRDDRAVPRQLGRGEDVVRPCARPQPELLDSLGAGGSKGPCRILREAPPRSRRLPCGAPRSRRRRGPSARQLHDEPLLRARRLGRPALRPHRPRSRRDPDVPGSRDARAPRSRRVREVGSRPTSCAASRSGRPASG